MLAFCIYKFIVLHHKNCTAISQREKKKELVAAVTSYAPTLAEYETRERAGRLPFVYNAYSKKQSIKGTMS